MRHQKSKSQKSSPPKITAAENHRALEVATTTEVAAVAFRRSIW
jgi:hypothetical protein